MPSLRFDPNGPAVMLGNASSIFPQQLAADWIKRGRQVCLVSEFANGDLADECSKSGIQPINSYDFRRRGMKWLRAGNPLLRWLERSLPRWRLKRYQDRTGRDKPEPWEWYWVDHFWDSFCRARAALARRPQFVFGHEASSHGLATALCKGVPRILFPWGADIFNAVEASPFINAIVTRALKKIDLIVPSSTTAARFIPDRFGVPDEKVVSVSWGVDLQLFQRADAEKAAKIRNELGAARDATIVMNVRRFNPMWGAFEALESCLRLSTQRDKVHFVFLGGAGNESHVEEARRKIDGTGAQHRFTMFKQNISLEKCADLMSIADINLSLLGRGDMRSSSVLQGAACGGVPLLLESDEYREMVQNGFAAEFVQSVDTQQIEAKLIELIDQSDRRQQMQAANIQFIRQFEDHERQMDRMLELIDEVKQRYLEQAE